MSMMEFELRKKLVRQRAVAKSSLTRLQNFYRILDSEIHKEWEIQTATQQDISTTSTVINFLEARCKALELLQANQSKSTTSQQSPQERTKVSQSSWCN